mgnify:FL=1
MFQKLLNTIAPSGWYVVAGLGAILLALSAVIYIQDLKIDKYSAQLEGSKTALKTSKQSIDTLTAEINNTREAWKAKAELDARKQAETQELLKNAEEKNKKLLDIAEKLRTNKTGNTPIPKDVKDAWNTIRHN